MISALDTAFLQKARQPAENTDELESLLKRLSRLADDNAIDRVITLYEKTIVTLEKSIWHNRPTTENIKQYQDAFTVLEKLHELKTADLRYSFKIVIPVADRPQHLKYCLDSLLTLCKCYNYGGCKDKTFNKISVLIADDSKDADNIKLHKAYCEEFTLLGINAEYFGLEEQLALVTEINKDNDSLKRIISSIDNIGDPTGFSHKGASIMRNITYLKLNRELSQDKKSDNTLIYFIDSDQEFCINIPDSDDKLYAINYFHYLNAIFTSQDISILTGKVVGDPPVSPSVMAGNFQQDIQNFLTAMKEFDPELPCQFHQQDYDESDDAAYHDMANLFGFTNHEQAFDYHCTLRGEHDNIDCYCDFSEKLGRFFYGEHPTRKTFFHYENGFFATAPARTVYTGNYVIKPENLQHFIPFATLKLRMAGPVLGRLLNSKLHKRFVSANLPMLHNRTIEATGQSEFRAGVKNKDTKIDLGNEFIRQFYGDVMLFSIKRITEQDKPYDESQKIYIQAIVESTYGSIKQNYIDKHHKVLQLKASIQAQLEDKNSWWNKTSNQPEGIDMQSISIARENFNTFLQNIQSNFDEGSFSYQQISVPGYAEKYLQSISNAIIYYHSDMDSWKEALDS